MNIIAIEHLNLSILKSKSDGYVEIFKDLSYTIDEGKWHYVKGHNAVGKSLFLKLVSNTLERRHQIQLSGEIRLFGQPHDSKNTKIDNRISFIRQDNHFISNFNVLENLMTPLLVRKIKISEAKQRGKDLLKSFNLEHLEKLHVDQLSGGQKKLLSIMMGLITEPVLLLIDEPINELDEANTKLVMDYLIRMKHSSQLAVILTSHINLPKIYDDIYTIENNQLVKT